VRGESIQALVAKAAEAADPKNSRDPRVRRLALLLEASPEWRTARAAFERQHWSLMLYGTTEAP
jgi:hypothetical protein